MINLDMPNPDIQHIKTILLASLQKAMHTLGFARTRDEGPLVLRKINLSLLFLLVIDPHLEIEKRSTSNQK